MDYGGNMKKTGLTETQMFILKRAFRHGEVLRGDIVKVFGVSTATATRAMVQAEKTFHDILVRSGKFLKPLPMATPPSFAGEEKLLMDLDAKNTEPSRTGLFPHELPVTYVSWTNAMPHKPGVFLEIVTAISRQLFLRIIYVGLKRGHGPEEKEIVPIALEKMNDQWRLIGQDLNIKGCPIRVYVLSRILEASKYKGRKPSGCVFQNEEDGLIGVPVKLNPELTEWQQKVISRELGVTDGKVLVKSRSQYEFKRRFMGLDPESDYVWPPLKPKET